MRISDWSSDVCSSDLRHAQFQQERALRIGLHAFGHQSQAQAPGDAGDGLADGDVGLVARHAMHEHLAQFKRSEEHTSELQSLMRISYAVFCLKKKKQIILSSYHKHHE